MASETTPFALREGSHGLLYVPEEAKKDYEHLKEAILDVLGLSVKECRADYFMYYKKPCESWQEAARSVEFYVNRMIYGCDTKQDIVSMFALRKVLSLFPPDCLTFVQLQKPGSATEAASHIQEFFKWQNKGRSHRPWMRNGEKGQQEGNWGCTSRGFEPS